MTSKSDRNRRKLWLIALALMPLSACATARSDVCGVLFTYDAGFQRQAGTEVDYLKGTGQAPHVVQLVEDYQTTRDTIRACGK